MANSTDSKPVDPLEVQNSKLRSSIRHLFEEQTRSNSKLIGVQVLTDQLDKKSEECNFLISKVRQYEVLLSRAENRIAQLSVKNAKGASPNQGGIVTPGISKKLLEALTRENTKLKLALEHVLNKQPNGIELAVENRDLHDLVLALKEELHQNRKETEELRGALKAVETDDSMALKQQIARLTAQVTQIERSLKAKQVYCESVVSENERLKSNLEAKSERITHLTGLNKLKDQHPAIKDVLDLTSSSDNIDGQTKDIESYTKQIESLQKTIKELKEQRAMSFEQSKKHHEEFSRQIQELMHANATLHDEIEKVKNDNQEVNMVKDLLQGQCKDFENDFKMERQEKEKLNSDMKRLIKQYQELQQENNALKKDNEKIKKLIKDEFDRKQQKQISPTTTNTHWQNSGFIPQHYNPAKNKEPVHSYMTPQFKPPHFNPMKLSEQVCADGPGAQNLKPHNHINSGSANSYLECPVCKMILPPNEIEDHLNDCDGRK